MPKKKIKSETKNIRPLSPHLQIYSPQITSVLSIFHRITGATLTFSTVFLTCWLLAAAHGPDTFESAQTFMGSWFGQLVLLSISISFFYHLANGIRHLIWDAGYGFELTVLRVTGILVVLIAIALTTLTWIVALIRAGVLHIQ